MKDSEYMELALMLAKNGLGWTAPNPMVGAVLVKDGEIIGQGWHEKCGEPHAERNALANCKKSPQGATLYVTLEPCCHQGRQPPCVDAILEAGIRRVVVGSADPNPLVAGKGIRILREHGIEVTEHMLEEECDRLNEVFFHYIQTKRPFVVMKYAMTMDGKGECVGGIAMMLKGANANVVTQELEKRVEKIQHLLPEGISIEPYLNRSELVNRNISTVVNNLIEGAIIVFLVLIIFLGNVRAGLIVASVIPLAMLFAFIMMRLFNVTANLMSLGAIDFGIVVDGSIVILEGILAHIYSKQFRGRTLTRKEMDEEVEYTIVGSTEADALNGKISNESPVGAALIGSKVGETIVVETISGDLEFKILEIARA